MRRTGLLEAVVGSPTSCRRRPNWPDQTNGGCRRIVPQQPACERNAVRGREGLGLSPEERRRAFDRFWRGRAGEGSGLALAIVGRLVAADGGTVELKEAAPHGLEAVVHMPS